MVEIKSILRDFFKNKLITVLTVNSLILITILFILWRLFIQKNQLPVYSPIKIFPVQYALFIAVVNFVLALAAVKKSTLVSQLLICLTILVTALSILMVIYTYRFFVASV